MKHNSWLHWKKCSFIPPLLFSLGFFAVRQPACWKIRIKCERHGISGSLHWAAPYHLLSFTWVFPLTIRIPPFCCISFKLSLNGRTPPFEHRASLESMKLQKRLLGSTAKRGSITPALFLGMEQGMGRDLRAVPGAFFFASMDTYTIAAGEISLWEGKFWEAFVVNLRHCAQMYSCVCHLWLSEVSSHLEQFVLMAVLSRGLFFFFNMSLGALCKYVQSVLSERSRRMSHWAVWLPECCCNSLITRVVFIFGIY